MTSMTKGWILWKHDPCPEGGWHIACCYDTQEEAINAAKVTHAEEERMHLEMVEFCKPDPWPRSNTCYDGCMVTPAEVFRLEWPLTESSVSRNEEGK